MINICILKINFIVNEVSFAHAKLVQFYYDKVTEARRTRA